MLPRNPARFMPNAALSPSVAFTPASLSPNWWGEVGKGGLFQSNAGTTAAVANADVVGFFPDQSGNTITLTSAADDTTRPTLQGVGVFPYLSFDGTNDSLRNTSPFDSYNAGSSSWFATLRSNSNAANTYVICQGNSAEGNSIYCLMAAQSTTATTHSGQIRNTAGANLLAITQALKTSVFDGSDHVVGCIDNGTTVTPYLDGVAGTPFTYTARTGTVTLNRFSLASLVRSTVGSWWAGRIYGGIVVNRVLNSTEIANSTTYLGALAGLSL